MIDHSETVQSFFICGDIMINSYFDNFISDELKELISSADISICNFEGPINTKTKPILKAGPNLFQNKHAPEMIKKAGFTHCSLSNNHIYDYGDAGICSTISELEKNGLGYFGCGMTWEEAYSPQIIEKCGIRIALFSLCESEFGALQDLNRKRGGYAWINHHSINNLISATKRNGNLVMVIVHAGIEQIDAPLPEWRDRYRDLLDRGADIIIGGHPHVPQGYEIYNNKYIFYSLGNFFFDLHDTHPYWDKGIAIKINFDTTKFYNPELYFIKKQNSIVELDNINEIKIHYDYLCSLLHDNLAYYSYIDNIANVFWENVYKGYFEASLNSLNMKTKYQLLRLLIKKICKKDRPYISSPLLLHNLKIESHRWLIERYLTNSIEKSWN